MMTYTTTISNFGEALIIQGYNDKTMLLEM